MSFETNKAFYDRISESYDAIAHSSERESSEAGLKALAVEEGDQVLEVGYGTGHALVALAGMVGTTGRVIGLDVSEGMASVSQHRLEREGLASRVDLQVGAAPPLPFPEGEFDAVFFSFTLELFPPEVIQDVVREVRRVLKPGGRVAIVAMAKPRSHAEDTALEKAYVWMHRHFPHIVDCHPISVEKTLKDGGLTVTHSEHTDIWSLPVAVVVSEKDRG